jgi:hypothetical protein
MIDCRNTITADNGNAKFIWHKVEDDKWLEQYWQREHEDGSTEWVHVHDTRYLTTEQVDNFTRRLAEVGFTVTERGGAPMEELQKEVERLTELNEQLKAENAEMNEIIIRLKAELYDYMSM